MGKLKDIKGSRTGPPKGAPEGTVWFGGPVDKCKVTLRVDGENLDPDEITIMLGQNPTMVMKASDPIRAHDGSVIRISKIGRWHLTISSEDEGAPSDMEDLIDALFSRLPTEPALWSKLTEKFKVDLFCGLFLYSDNRGFGLSPSICRFLGKRGIEIGFDIYFDPKRRAFLEAARKTPNSRRKAKSRS
jgi:uncharacterized protein DUF4279